MITKGPLLEQENMWFWLMYLIVFPSQALTVIVRKDCNSVIPHLLGFLSFFCATPHLFLFLFLYPARLSLLDGKVTHPFKVQKDCRTYLSYTKRAPFLLPEQFQCAFRGVKIIGRNFFEHVFWELHMSIFIFVVGVPIPVQCIFPETNGRGHAYLAE